MNRLRRRLSKVLVAASLTLCILIFVTWIGSMVAGRSVSLIWNIGSTRCMLYVEPSNAGFSATPSWPYSGKDPGWIFPNSGLELPVVTAMVCLAIPSFLKLCESATAVSPRKMKIRKCATALVVGVMGFAWFFFVWLNQMSDDLEHWIAGSFAIAVPVILIWLGSRRLVGLLRKPRDPGICRQCGYDLRATPHRCPECGTSVASPETRRIDHC